MDNIQRENDLHRRKVLLLVDDDEISGDILSSFFPEDKFSIHRAYNGKQCLDIIENGHDTIDLVLLDIFMPEMTGVEVLKARKDNPNFKKIPVIVMTSDKQSEKECFSLGANDYIKKPYDNPDVILARVNRMIELYDDRSIIKEVKRDKLTSLFSLEFFKKYAVEFDEVHPEIKKDMLAINITKFHLVNELYGHHYGDEVLKNIGQYLKDYLNKIQHGLAGRIGADSFVLYCPHHDDYSLFLNDLLDHINKLTNSSGIHLRVGIYPNVDPTLDKDIIIGRAISTAESIKEDLNKLYAIYDHEAQEKAFFEEELVNSFETALTNNEFKMYYQPKYAIQGEKNTLSSAEALIRWISPKHGMISPGKFIPLFEENGLIQKLDRYVFEEVARQQAKWKDSLGYYFPVSVNVSGVDIVNPDLVNEVIEVVDKYHIPHDKYLIEITESACVTNPETALSLIKSFKENGFLIEIDDFGTGYSALSLLTEYPFDVIKIDMGFIRKVDKDERNKYIIQMIINLCRNFKVKSICEGVETESHYLFLKESGCDIIQGYYFSKPLPSDDMTSLLIKEK